MTIKQLKEILNKTNVFDNAVVRLDIQDGEGSDCYELKEIGVEWGMGGVPKTYLIGTTNDNVEIDASSKYAETDATAWGRYYYGFTKEGVWDIENGEYNCYGEKEDY